MQTILLTAIVELAGRLRQRSLYVIIGALVILAWSSIAVGAKDFSARRQAYTKQLSDLARDQVQPRTGLLGWVSEPVLRVVRPPELGSILARGEDVTVPAFVDFGPGGSIWARSVSSDTVQLQAGPLLDLESLIRVLGGVLGVLLGIDAVATRRASGLLKAWEAVGASRVLITVGQILGCWTVVATTTVIVFAAAALSAVSQLPDDGRDLILLFARCAIPTLLYLCSFATIGAACAVWFKHQTTALVGGVGFWIGAVMIWPQIVMLGARLQAPHELRVNMEAARDQAFTFQIRTAENALGNAVEAWVGQLPPEPTEDAVEVHRPELEALWLVHARDARSTAETIEEAWRQSQERQARMDRLGGYLSPSMPFLRAMTAVSGTGTLLARRWREAINERQQALNKQLFDDRPQVTLRVPAQQARQIIRFPRHKAKGWQELGSFEAPAQDAGQLWRSAVAPLAALLGYLGLAVALATIGAWRLRL